MKKKRFSDMSIFSKPKLRKFSVLSYIDYYRQVTIPLFFTCVQYITTCHVENGFYPKEHYRR